MPDSLTTLRLEDFAQVKVLNLQKIKTTTSPTSTPEPSVASSTFNLVDIDLSHARLETVPISVKYDIGATTLDIVLHIFVLPSQY